MPAQLLTTAMTNCDTSATTVLLSHSTSLVQFNSDDDNLQYYPGFNSFIYRKVKKFQALMFYFRSEWGWKKTMIRKDFFDFNYVLREYLQAPVIWCSICSLKASRQFFWGIHINMLTNLIIACNHSTDLNYVELFQNCREINVENLNALQSPTFAASAHNYCAPTKHKQNGFVWIETIITII